MYVDYEFYKTLYGTTVDETVFNRLIWNAEKLVKNAVTGVDVDASLILHSRMWNTMPKRSNAVNVLW